MIATLASMVAFGALALASPARAAITKGPWVQRVTPTSAVVRVEVDPPAAVSIDVGPGADAGARARTLASPSRGLHSITVDGLQASTRYAVSVRSGGATKTGSFATAPPPIGGGSFHVLVYGDTRTDQATHAAIVHAMLGHASDFMIHTGDFVDTGSSPSLWQTFFDIEAPLLSTRCLVSCVGNHELIDRTGVEYAKYFGPTELAFDPKTNSPQPPEHLDGSFRWGTARFFLLNGMVGFRDTVDRAWLERALSDADNEPGLIWRIVVVHHGLFSSGPHGSNARLVDAGIPALLKAHKIDLVISGHDHIYERGSGDGMAYLVSGGAGAPLYRIKATVPEAQKSESVHHFIDMVVADDTIQSIAYRIDDSVLDRCTLRKGAANWDCADSRRTSTPAASVAPGGIVPLASATPASGSDRPDHSRCGCRAVGSGGGGGLPWGVLGLLGAAALRRARRRHRLAT